MTNPKHTIYCGLDHIGFDPEEVCLSCFGRIEEKLRIAREALERIDKRCLKYGVLPDKKTCTDIKQWKDNTSLFCHGCFAEDALGRIR